MSESSLFIGSIVKKLPITWMSSFLKHKNLVNAHATGDALALVDFSEWRALAGSDVD